MTDKTMIQIADTRLFAGFTDEEREQVLVAGNSKTCSFSKDETVFYEGTLLDSVIILLEGRMQGVHFLEDGSLNLVHLFLPGEVIGLDIVCTTSRKTPYSLCGVQQGSFLSLDYDAIFSKHLDRGALRKMQDNVIHELARDSMKRLHKIEVLYRKSLRERICVFLRNRAVLSGKREVQIDMDREQFAQYLGVNRSSLSHELAMMRRDGLIEFHKGSFTILSEEVFR